MSWEGGVDIAAVTSAELEMPNVIVHVARMVHTPVGSAPSGMILIPGADGAPKVMGFISTDKKIGEYFGPNIFAGTPFEAAPVLTGTIEIENSNGTASAVVRVGADEIRVKMSGLGDAELVERQSPMLPFRDDSVEAAAAAVELFVNDEKVNLILPPQGMSGGPAAVFSSCGIYSR